MQPIRRALPFTISCDRGLLLKFGDQGLHEITCGDEVPGDDLIVRPRNESRDPAPGDHGGGDSGQIDNVLAFGPKPESGPTPEMELPEGKVTLRVPSFDHPKAQEQTFSLREAIEELCWVVLGSRHPGWEINDGGEGVFILDVARGTIELRHTQFFRDDGPDGWEW